MEGNKISNFTQEEQRPIKAYPSGQVASTISIKGDMVTSAIRLSEFYAVLLNNKTGNFLCDMSPVRCTKIFKLTMSVVLSGETMHDGTLFIGWQPYV